MNQDPLQQAIRGRTLLVIDDTDAIRHHVVDFLRSRDTFDEYLEAPEGVTGFRILCERRADIDLVLCDLEMPQIDGFRFLHMKANKSSELEELRDIPVIMLTARTEVDKKIKGLDLGASDYLTKPFDEGELLARVRVQLKVKSLQDQLRRLSMTDALTGMFNRRHVMEMMATEFSRSLRYEEPFSLIMIDIDHFKSVNDKLGHQAGDEVLRHVSSLFTKGLRNGDMIGRYGGEEFALVLPHTGIEGAMAAGERYRRIIAEAGPVSGAEPVTISLGVSSNQLPGVTSVDRLLQTADQALYAAKRQGRNRVVCFDTELETF